MLHTPHLSQTSGRIIDWGQRVDANEASTELVEDGGYWRAATAVAASANLLVTPCNVHLFGTKKLFYFRDP